MSSSLAASDAWNPSCAADGAYEKREVRLYRYGRLDGI